MIRKLITSVLFISFNLAAFSQLNTATVKNSYEIKKEIPAKAYLQLAKALKPSAITGSYEKQMKSISGNVSSDMNGEMMTKKILLLSGSIKPEMFKKGFKLSTGPFAKTMNYSMGLLKDLENGLKPEALTDGWKFQKNAWLEEMSKIK